MRAWASCERGSRSQGCKRQKRGAHGEHRRGPQQAGERFAPGTSYDGFLEGFPVQFVPVAREHRETYMLSASWLHGGPKFDGLQLIWPSTEGIFPWEPNASAWLRANQPILS